MTDMITTLTSILTLLSTASLMIIITLVFSGFKLFKLQTANSTAVAKVSIGIILGLLAICGTYMGTKMPDGTIINVRELSIMIAGVAGGPISGVIAGLIGGIHRFTVGGATALPCTVSTILIGVIAGLVSTRLTGKMYLLKGAVLGIVLESAAMGFILVLLPFNQGLSIVEKIAVPMIAANTIGLVLWLYLVNKRETTTR